MAATVYRAPIPGITARLLASIGPSPEDALLPAAAAPFVRRRNSASPAAVFSRKQRHPLGLPQISPSTTRWLCRSRHSVSIPPDGDDEFRSSRNIAISLFRRYRNVIERGGGDTLKEFIGAGVNAYALGCTDQGLLQELTAIRESGAEIQAMENYGGITSVQSRISAHEVDECMLWVSIVFITILCTPQPTIVRWSSVPPASDEMLLYWKGFCALIANAYFVRGMAWLPVKTLQLEQMAVAGRAEEPSVVASRMRLVFSTLEVVCPQWPRV
ncbi:unnamed protein product [Linum trigynum]|uniref:DUF7876 domain-containing protein n=1 Tax=Linum trigynum TaxID=586398 RepID=A0AAV2FH36_9ROSI